MRAWWSSRSSRPTLFANFQEFETFVEDGIGSASSLTQIRFLARTYLSPRAFESSKCLVQFYFDSRES
jgi:hypothetical protein